MTTEWIITVISLSLTSLMSLSSIIIPFIMSFKEKKVKDKEREIDLVNQTIDKLMSGYGEYRTNSYHTLHLFSAIYNTMIFCSKNTNLKLQSLCDKISNHVSNSDTDKLFYECINALQIEFKFNRRKLK